jgi:hypothetical protein
VCAYFNVVLLPECIGHLLWLLAPAALLPQAGITEVNVTAVDG